MSPRPAPSNHLSWRVVSARFPEHGGELAKVARWCQLSPGTHLARWTDALLCNPCVPIGEEALVEGVYLYLLELAVATDNEAPTACCDYDDERCSLSTADGGSPQGSTQDAGPAKCSMPEEEAAWMDTFWAAYTGAGRWAANAGAQRDGAVAHAKRKLAQESCRLRDQAVQLSYLPPHVSCLLGAAGSCQKRPLSGNTREGSVCDLAEAELMSTVFLDLKAIALAHGATELAWVGRSLSHLAVLKACLGGSANRSAQRKRAGLVSERFP
jgi:hypothetical protein